MKPGLRPAAAPGKRGIADRRPPRAFDSFRSTRSGAGSKAVRILRPVAGACVDCRWLRGSAARRRQGAVCRGLLRVGRSSCGVRWRHRFPSPSRSLLPFVEARRSGFVTRFDEECRPSSRALAGEGSWRRSGRRFAVAPASARAYASVASVRGVVSRCRAIGSGVAVSKGLESGPKRALRHRHSATGSVPTPQIANRSRRHHTCRSRRQSCRLRVRTALAGRHYVSCVSATSGFAAIQGTSAETPSLRLSRRGRTGSGRVTEGESLSPA